MPIDRIWAIFGSSFGLFDWCLCFFRHPSLSLVPFIPDQPPTFRSKNLFSRGKNIFSFCFFCAPFGSLLRARTIIYTLPFVFFLGRGPFFLYRQIFQNLFSTGSTKKQPPKKRTPPKKEDKRERIYNYVRARKEAAPKSNFDTASY